MLTTVKELRSALTDPARRAEAEAFWKPRLSWSMVAVGGGSLMITLVLLLTFGLLRLPTAETSLLFPTLADIDMLVPEILAVAFLAQAFSIGSGGQDLETLQNGKLPAGRFLACRWLARMRGLWIAMLVYVGPLLFKKVAIVQGAGWSLDRLYTIPLDALQALVEVTLCGAGAALCGTLARGTWAILLGILVVVFLMPIPVYTVWYGSLAVFALASGMGLQAALSAIAAPALHPGVFVISSLTTSSVMLLMILGCLAAARTRLSRLRGLHKEDAT